MLYTENESNAQRLWGVENRAPFVKDGINDTVVNRAEGRLNPQGVGTKVAVHYPLVIVPDETKTVLLRLSANPQSMPFAQAWEYPWFAAWDLAFHCMAMSMIDIDFAKRQLLLLLRKQYMHPNGQLPAYERAFSDVNPPVHAATALHMYKREKSITGTGDIAFLERVFHKLLLNFTWWVNRKDSEDNNVFDGDTGAGVGASHQTGWRAVVANLREQSGDT